MDDSKKSSVDGWEKSLGSNFMTSPEGQKKMESESAEAEGFGKAKEDEAKEDLIEVAGTDDELEEETEKADIQNAESINNIKNEREEALNVAKNYWDKLHNVTKEANRETAASSTTDNHEKVEADSKMNNGSDGESGPEEQELSEKEMEESREFVRKIREALFGGSSQEEEKAKKELCSEYDSETMESLVRDIAKNIETEYISQDQKEKLIQEAVKGAEEEIKEEREQNSDSSAETDATNEAEGENEFERYEVKEDLTEQEVEEGNRVLREVEEILFGGEAQTDEEKEMAREYMSAENKDELIAKARDKYAYELGVPPGSNAETLLREQKNIEDKLGKTELADGLKFKEKEFLKILKEGEDLIDEGNPEKVKAYLESMAENIDDCANRLKYMYLQMEMNPEARKTLQEEYITLTNAIKKFEEASAILKNLIKMVDEAGKQGRNLNEVEKKKLNDFWKKFGKIIVLLGAIAAIIYGIAKYAASHPAASVGAGGVTAGLVKAGAIGAGGISAAATADLLLKAYALKLLIFDEEKRDKWVERLCGITLPSWAKKPPKKSEKSESKPAAAKPAGKK